MKEKYQKEDSTEDMDESIEGYNKWRPREKEDGEDLTKKTVEGASIKEKNVERDFQGTNEELRSAGEKVKESINGAKVKGKSAILELKNDASISVNGLVKSKTEKSKSVDKETEERRDESNREQKSASAELKEASKCINRLFGSKSIKSLRKMEEAIYKQVMLKFNPYYFDTEYFSVNLEEKKDGDYLLTVNIPNEELRQTIKKGLREEN